MHSGMAAAGPTSTLNGGAPGQGGGRHDSICTVYVGNLPSTVTEGKIMDLFQRVGPIKHCKVLYPSKVDPYCFIEFYDHRTAEQAIKTMNKEHAFGKYLRVNWALSGPGGQNADDDFPVFVGDLSADVDEELLQRHFSHFGQVIFVRIMRDVTTAKSRCYGFVTFANKQSAEVAISKMNGFSLLGKPIKANWAIKKGKSQTVEEIASQSSPHNSTVYIGNLSRTVSEKSLRKHCEEHGSVLALRIFPEKGYAFIKYESHEIAARAIYSLNGQTFHGQVVKCSWGKENFDVPGRQHGQVLSQFVGYPTASGMAPVYPYTTYYFSPYSVVGVEGQAGANSLSLPVQPTLPPQSPYFGYNSFTIPQSPTFLQPSQFQQGTTGGGGSSHFMQMAATTPSPLYPVYPVQQQQQ